jgi:23S rRNA (adenine2503-C2)-methyltransferase
MPNASSGTHSLLGLTLDQYARSVGTSRQFARRAYVGAMRDDIGVDVPDPTRVEEDEGVVKFCLPCDGGFESESVIIPMDSYRGTQWHTLCVSSQIGCRMGCTFCETGRMGLRRNLTPAEIVAQWIAARRLMRGRNGVHRRSYTYFRDGIQNIVFMGMGEPLDNLSNVIQTIRVLSEQNGLAVPHAQITVSTVGRVDGLRELAALARAEPLWRNLRLAVSLNAPNDVLRTEIMPINKGMPLATLQKELLAFPLAPRARMLIEYVMLAGVNDTPAHADQIADWCRPLPCVVNLIPYNPQRDASYAAPDDETMMRFLMRLRANGVFVKRRVTYGRRLMGACGQLGNAEVRRLEAGAEAGAQPSAYASACEATADSSPSSPPRRLASHTS